MPPEICKLPDDVFINREFKIPRKDSIDKPWKERAAER
jgi:hypothetical protein